ncbi:PREDICTED: feruloyl CoA ortho-hydroxylase 1-like [Camelina sativa]|uniref:Feruloyl CoA ortho-hydroxylase 1-like n=1 Tax=Camelina sativa TaxID=90675 RepID=A0ABM0XWF2_CAMSA|nr:PREDICTED: feruloyl CoA ortho-hydroxylase 1-like [Camelina sativa]
MSPATTDADQTASSDDFEVRDYVVNQRNGVKGLVDFLTLTALPSVYIQAPQERFTSDKILVGSPVPVIDVSNWNDPNVAREICHAATTLGLFQIVNHGIAPEELKGIVAAARGFFELPAEERRKYWRGSSVSKTAWLTTSFNPYKESVLEWRDFLKFEYLPQQHNFAITWPPVCKEQVIDHFKKIKPITEKILNILINNLNSVIDDSNKQTLMGTMRMNFNYYPKCPEPSLAIGTGRHSDINTLTLLLQEDGVLGSLFARATEDGDKWIHVPPMPGAIVVNIGDVLQILSNDRYRSVEHCVVVNKCCSRVSIPVFCGPVHDSVIEPLPEVLEYNETARYRKTVYSDYLKGFFERPHDGKKTIESIKLP